MTRVLPADLVDFIESGVSILVGTRDASLRPEATRAVGAQVASDRAHVSVFLAERWAARTIADLEQTGVIAVGFSRMFDNYSIQLKGDGAVVREAGDADRLVPERWRAAYVEQLYMGGIPRSLMSRIHVWPAKIVTFAVGDIFVQTPGPGAGARLEQK